MLSFCRACCAGVPQRWIFAVMACLSILNAYAMRICLSLAITEMVTTTVSSSNDTNLDDTCPTLTDETWSDSSSAGTYEWDEYTKGVILSSFFWGYLITQLPGGVLAEKYGGKYTLGLGILSTAIFSILTPLVTETFNSTGLIVLRIMMGVCEGTTFPAVSVMIAQWAPPLERSKMTAVVMSGMAMGTIVGNALTGVLIEYSPIGWPIVFYVYGALGILWFCAWVILCYSRPDDHPFITEEERRYLNETASKYIEKNRQPTPWRHMIRSSPFWALVIAMIGIAWGHQIMLVDLPLYMSNILHYSIETNGYLSALPHGLLWIVASLASWLADWLIKSERLSRTNVRKVSHVFATVLPATFIIAASYAGCDRTLVVILFTIGVGTLGPFYITVMINPNDLSLNHSGTLMGVVNGTGALSGILVPYIVGVLTPNQTLSEWRIAFWITFVLFAGSSVVFSIWGSGDVQYWDDLDSWKNQQKDVENKRSENEDMSSAKLPDTF